MSESNETRAANGHGLRNLAAAAASMPEVGSTSLELRRAVRALRALSACNQALVHASCESDLLDSICRVIVGHAGYRLAWVGYVVHDAEQVRQAGRPCGFRRRLS